MKKLANKTAVITGGNSGIGFETAKEFIAQGAKVIITGRNENAVNAAVAQLGENAYGVIADSNNMSEIFTLPGQVKAITPTIDIVFINAGMGKFNSVQEMSEEMFDEIMDINFKGAYFTLQQLLPIVNEGGSIIFNTSINAHIGMAGASVYSASKAALLSLTKNLAVELLPRKIRVNSVSPGPVVTPFHTTEKLGLSEDQLQQMGEAIVSQVPIGRFGTMEELAKVVTFFASDDSTFLLGSELIADGGMYNL
jgi:NAD(P)-dependent dehydrogenase (short-subunit alcohol dehydrogenase family)